MFKVYEFPQLTSPWLVSCARRLGGAADRRLVGFMPRHEPPVQRSLAVDVVLGTPPPSTFAEEIRRVADLLPHQGILENFVHHNPLESLQSLTFSDAVARVAKLELYAPPGERVLALLDIDPRKRANEALVGVSSAFLDRGAAKWAPRFRDRGFLHFWAALEGLGFAPWRSHARATAVRCLKANITPDAEGETASVDLAESILRENAEFFGIPVSVQRVRPMISACMLNFSHLRATQHAEAERLLFAKLMELPGWAGMFYRMETHIHEAPAGARVRLMDFCAVQSTLARSSISDMAYHAGWDPMQSSFPEWFEQKAVKSPVACATATNDLDHSVQGVSAVAFIDQTAERREAIEVEIEHSLLATVENNSALSWNRSTTESVSDSEAASATGHALLLDTGIPASCVLRRATAVESAPPELQVFTCIDDREYSLRRHIEQIDQRAETFGLVGFFGLPMRYVPVEGAESTLAPEGQHPAAVLVEVDDAAHVGEVARFKRRRHFFARFTRAWEDLSFSPFGSLALAAVFPLSIARLALIGYAPLAKQRVRDAFSVRRAMRCETAPGHPPPPHPLSLVAHPRSMARPGLPPKPPTDFAPPFSPAEAATLLAKTLKSIGAHRRFAPLVLVLGHGAASQNNPFAAAYNCGACGGREGGPNARLFARVANDPAVRDCLAADHGIAIPTSTVFVGARHNTTADEIVYFDVDRLPFSHRDRFTAVQATLELARGRNALERCQRFLLAGNVTTTGQALRHVGQRAVDTSEVRPELNHATNAAVIVGRRELTRGCSFDRRAFLPSYDPYSDDVDGTLLEIVLAPALTVCSGINLEYLFSTAMASRHGAGTKAPLNIVGNIAVLQGTSGDLRPGLPSQMTEMHTPVRALFLVDAPLSRITAVLARRPELAQLVHNEWVRFVVRDPTTGRFFRHTTAGSFVHTADHQGVDLSSLRSRQLLHMEHGFEVARRETAIYIAASCGMAAVTLIPIYMFSAFSMNPHGALTALIAASLAFPVLAFSRRYLHGEFMFGRCAFLSVGLLFGFNLVATAPDLIHLLAGWSLFGFSSTFLIGSYNDRPTVRKNATYAFAAYRISDFALLTASAFTTAAPQAACNAISGHEGLVAACILVAAAFKSSQFPMTALFVRSMEGPTPTSALGYAGLSAHVGVVLLASTMHLWFPVDEARVALAAVGVLTMMHNSLVSRIRPDRKGAIARATSATLGLLFVILAAGFRDVALVLALGHAALRMVQILRAPNAIADYAALRGALGFAPWPRLIPDALYKLAWSLYRVDTDLHFYGLLKRISGFLHIAKPLDLSRAQQWMLTAVGVVIAGAPFTPFSHAFEELLIGLLHSSPETAVALMAAHFGLSVIIVRFLFVSVLTSQRFRRIFPSQLQAPGTPKKQ